MAKGAVEVEGDRLLLEDREHDVGGGSGGRRRSCRHFSQA